MISEVARRYAKALYEAAEEAKAGDRVLAELRAFQQAIGADAGLAEFIHSPTISAENKKAGLSSALKDKVSPTLVQFLLVLAENGRLALLEEMIQAFESISDGAHGVTRGTVRSASAMTTEAQKNLETAIFKVTKKKVIFSFENDPSLMGGLVATVGGWTFDDSLKAHLSRLGERLKRNELGKNSN